MIISFPTAQGVYSFCLNAAMLKFIACIVVVLMLIAGYSIVQLSAFILSATPEQFIRIVLFTLFLVGLLLLGRFLLNRKQVVA